MVYSGQIGQQTYNYYMPLGLPGIYEGMGQYRAQTYINGASGTQPTYTITPPATVDANTAYKVTVDGVQVTATSGGATTTAQLGTLLYNALRQEGLVYRKADITVNTSTGVITLVSRTINQTLAIAVNSAETTNDLTVANTVAAGTAVTIPHGRFVGRLASYGKDPISGLSNAALVNHATNFTSGGGQILGVVMKNFVEKTSRGPLAVAEIPFGGMMDVMNSVGTLKGIWVESVESDIVMTDTLYVAVGAGNEGKVSKTSSGNIDLSAKGRFVSDAVTALGKNIVLVQFTL